MDSMTLKLGQVQLMVGRDKAENLRRACVLIRRAAERGAQLVMLPEMFCCPYENEMFRPNSEEQGGPAQQALSALSRELGIWIVGGTARRALELCREAGVTMTGAGATYPYGVDPADSNIRIAPSLPPVAELEQAAQVLCTCLRLAALEKLGV